MASKSFQVRLIVGLLLGITVVMVILNFIYKFSATNITTIIGSSISGVFLVFIAVLQSKNSTHLTTITEKVEANTTDLETVKKGLDNVAFSIKESDLKAAEAGVKMFMIVESLNAKKEIDQIGTEVEKTSKMILSKEVNINAEIVKLIDRFNIGIADIIRKHNAYGLDDFDISFYKHNLINNIYNACNIVKKLGQDAVNDITAKIEKNIETYIDSLSSLSDLDNGKKRGKFADATLDFVEINTFNILNTYKALEKNIA